MIHMVTMRVNLFVDEGLGHSSYLVDLGDGSAALVDPPRFPSSHQCVAEAEGQVLAWTIDTHSHADYVTGSPGLAAGGATFIAPEASRLLTPHHAMNDGEQVRLTPAMRLTALATPGHTHDHFAFVLEQKGRAVALFSGGSLMVGAVGRTDLCGRDLAEPLAHQMFQSLRRFDGLPDDVTVYPTHGAGSFCSAPGTAERTSTMARERATNPLFALTNEDEFVATLLAGFGTFPPYFAWLPELNRRGPTRYDSLPTLPSLCADEVAHLVASGAIVVDCRPPSHFGAGHVPGSLSNTLRPVFASWLGWLVEPDRPIVFVLGPGQDRRDLVRQCLDVGCEHLAGELEGGVEAWAASGRSVATLPFDDTLDPARTLVDVRQADEFATGHVPRARNIELGAITAAVLADGPVTVMCGHGERAMTAASLLARRGRRDVRVFDGGPETWVASSGHALALGR